MLQNIHDNAKGWIAYVIVGLISIPFALVGINEFLGGGDARVVATVNGEDIALQTLQRTIQQQRQRLQRMFGGQLPPGFDDSSLRKGALEELINQKLLDQKAKEVGYRATNAEVLDQLMSIPNFQKDGKFDRQVYLNALRITGNSAPVLENNLREELTREHFIKGIRDSGFVPIKEERNYHALQNQKRSIDLYKIKVDTFKEGIQISDKQIQEYYNDNKHLFMTEEKVQLAYVLLDKEKLAESTEVTDEVLQAYYDENSDAYFSTEERSVSHILLAVSAKRDDEKTKALADKIYTSIKDKSKTFSDLVKEYSDDEQTLEKAGSLGKIAKGDMSADFDKAAFKLKKEEVSEPVKTALGYEIIRVDEIIPAVQLSLEKSRAKVEQDYRNNKADTLFYEKSELLARLAFEQSGSLEPAADSAELPIEKTELLSRQGTKEGITSNAAFLKESFSERVLAGSNSDVIDLSPTQVVVLRLLQQVPSKVKALDDVKAEIMTRLTDIEARKQAKEKGEAILAKLKESKSWAALTDLDVKVDDVQKYSDITRTNTNKDIAAVITHQLFKMSAPKANEANYAGIVDNNGDYFVLALNAVKAGTGEVSNSEKQRYANYFANRELQAAIKTIRSLADVEINETATVDDK